MFVTRSHVRVGTSIRRRASTHSQTRFPRRTAGLAGGKFFLPSESADD